MGLLPDIEIYEFDQSYVEPASNLDIGIYIPLFSPKGIDNKVIRVSSPSELINKFGKPDDTTKYGLGFLYAYKATQYSSNVLVVRLLPNDAAYANIIIGIPKEAQSNTVQSDVNNDVTISIDDASNYSAGDRILIQVINPSTNTVYYEYRTVVSVDTDNNTITINTPVTVYQNNKIYKLQQANIQNYKGSTGYGATNESQFDGIISTLTTPYNIAIYPVGRGQYYNNLIIKFERNIDLERRYVDPITGKPLYPFNFWNIYIFEQDPETGILTLLEDPITVSILEKDNRGNYFKHPVTGAKLFIGTALNDYSENIKAKVYIDNSQITLQQVIPAAFYYALESNNIIKFDGGYDGTLDDNTKTSLLISAYNGSLNEDIAKILESSVLHKSYDIHLIPDCGYNLSVKGEIINLANIRKDCVALLSVPYSEKYTNDISVRVNNLPQSTYYALLDSGEYIETVNPLTGDKIYLPPSYFRLARILENVAQYGIPTPPAFIKYGSITETVFNISYVPNKAQANELLQYQINPILKTKDGIYFGQELTMFKANKILSRFYAIFTLVQFKKDIPNLVKDLLMEKATDRIIREAKERVSRYLRKWLVGGDPKFEAIKNYSVKVNFDEASLTLYIYITVRFLRVIEQIRIPIIVK